MKTPAAPRGGYSLAPHNTLGQYRIVRPLGRGGMGEVYEAEHQTLGRRYALKLLPADFDRSPDALDRFRREARVMANLAEAYGGKVPQETLLPVLRQVLQALDFAHGHGAVHRDLKPGNILLTAENT
jgi:serine/threonine-protein kinase